MSRTNALLSRRRFLGLVGAAAGAGLGTALTACSPTTPAASPEPEEAAEAPVDTSVPAAGGGNLIWYNNADPVRNKWEEDIIAMFSEHHPEIKVELMIVPWDEFESKHAALIAAGRPPDVWSEWGSAGFGDYYHRGMLLPITEFVERDAEELELDDYDPGLLDIFRAKGDLYGIPMFHVNNPVFYNKTLFDEAGIPYPTSDWEDKTWTFDKMLDLALELTKPAEDPTAAVWGLEYGGYMQHACAGWPWGKDYFGPNLGEEAYANLMAEQATVNDPDIIEALQWQADLRHVHKVSPTQAAYQALSALGGAFASGKLAMSVAGGWGFWVWKSITEFEWGVAALPWGPISRRSVMYNDPWFIGKQTADPEVTWTFVKYLATDEGLKGFVDGLGCPPAKKSMLERFVKLYPMMSSEDLVKVTQGGIADQRESPNHTILGFDEIYKTMAAELDRLWLGEATAAEIAPDMEAGMNVAIKSAAESAVM